MRERNKKVPALTVKGIVQLVQWTVSICWYYCKDWSKEPISKTIISITTVVKLNFFLLMPIVCHTC